MTAFDPPFERLFYEDFNAGFRFKGGKYSLRYLHRKQFNEKYEIYRQTIKSLNMVQLTTEQRTFVIKTFYETNTLQQARVAFWID